MPGPACEPRRNRAALAGCAHARVRAARPTVQSSYTDAVHATRYAELVMRGRVTLLAAMLVPGAAGCSLLIPLDGTTGGSRDAGAEAAADDAGDDGATADAPDGDGARPVEAGGDAAPYPPGSWCATQSLAGLTFCDDFDDETTAFERWTSARFDVAGSGQLSNVAKSAPHALDVNVPAYTSSTYFLEALQEHVHAEPASSALSLAYDFQAPVTTAGDGGTGDLFVASIAQGPQAPRVAVALRIGPDGSALQEQDTDANGNNTFNDSGVGVSMPSPGTWAHVVFTIDFAGSTATVSFDGATALTLPLKGAWTAQADTDVYLGDWYLVSTPGFEMRYDDAVIRQP